MQYADPGNRGFVTLTAESLDALEDYIAWTENVSKKKLLQADEYMARFLAMLSGSYAQKYSAGMRRHPDDSTRSWAMPVPRITNRYFLGWRVERLGRGAYVLTNDSREAFFIEYGIHRNPATGTVSPRRIRRPVFKMSFLRTMETVQRSSIAHRVWADVLVPKPGEPGRRTRNLTWYSQPSGIMGEIPKIMGMTPAGPIMAGRSQRYRMPGRGHGRIRQFMPRSQGD